MSKFAINIFGYTSFKIVERVPILIFFILLPDSIVLDFVWSGIHNLISDKGKLGRLTHLPHDNSQKVAPLFSKLLISLFRKNDSLLFKGSW